MAIDTKDLLTLIREAEANGNYDIAIKKGTGRGEDLDLTGLTVGEVRALQRRRKKDHGTPMGAYQITDKTLDYLVTSRGFDNGQLFDEATQDAMAYALLERRGLDKYYNNEISDEEFLKNVATEWAGIPDITNKSVWDGIAGNRSQVPVERVIAALPKRQGRKPDPLRIQLAQNELEPAINYESVFPEPRKTRRDDMLRSDGSIKSSKGFIGPITNQAGETMTEFTTDLGEEYGGYPANYNIPTLIPGLNSAELAVLKKSEGGKPLDMSQPLSRSIVNKARKHAKQRIDNGLNPLYQDFEEYSDVGSVMNQRLAEVSVGVERVPETLKTRKQTRVRPASEIYAGSAVTQGVQALQEMTQPAPDDGLRYVSAPARSLVDESYEPESDYDRWLQQHYQNYKRRRTEELTGAVRSFVGGLSFQLADEAEALLRASAKEEGSYEEELAIIREQQDRYELLNPGTATALEAAGAIPTGAGLSAGLTRVGVTKAMPQAGAEGFAYGAGSGDTFEERVQFATVGAAGGMALGKVIDMATTPSSAGGFRTKANDEADSSLPIESQPADLNIEQALDNEIYKEVDNPRYTRKPLKEAATFGELYDGIKLAVSDFYDDKLTGLSDRIMRRVSGEVGGRIQRADQAALFVVGKELESMSKDLVPVIKIINESEKAKGAMLDYAAGKMFTDKEIFDLNKVARKLTPAGRRAFRKKLQTQSLERLEKALGDELSTEHFSVLSDYLVYSNKKNSELNVNVFGAKFDDNDNAAINLTYLHTRNRAYVERLKEQGLTDDQIEARFMSDPAFEPRSRGRYADPDDPTRPLPSDYDNPIVSDMRRIFKMEQFNQLQKKFGVKVDEAAEVFERPLTLEEFLDEFAYTLERKGISREGSFFTRQQIADHIMGTAKTPHPLIQAANSLAYAVTLAGPMSAILNLADIPMLGAKYGGGAVREGLKVVSPFKKPPNPDLEKMGLNNQTFGEFVNLINDQVDNQQGWMARTAEKMRKGADFMMRGSGFAAMDRVGKQGVMRGVLKSAADDAEAGKLADNWGFYFNEAELNILSDQLQKHGMDWQNYTGRGSELIEELMFAGLGQQQLISAAGRPSAWARHPNLRPLWALRGFVIKQQALALREVMGNIKAGKPEEAAKFLGRYAAYGAGGYAVINEGRQFIFGDGEASFGGLARGYGDAWASLLTANTLGLNDYQYGQIKNIGLLPTAALGLEPIATSRARDLITTGIEVLDRDRPPQAMLTEVPFFKQTFRAGRNISELIGEPEAEGMFEEALRQRNN